VTTPTPPQPAYTYAAKVVRWVDGDTVDLAVDCGFHITVNGRFRLYGIDTPERGQANYVEARRFAQSLTPEGSDVVVKTYAIDEKYGRFLADIYPPHSSASVNEALVAAELAKAYFGGTKG